MELSKLHIKHICMYIKYQHQKSDLALIINKKSEQLKNNKKKFQRTKMYTVKSQ